MLGRSHTIVSIEDGIIWSYELEVEIIGKCWVGVKFYVCQIFTYLTIWAEVRSSGSNRSWRRNVGRQMDRQEYRLVNCCRKEIDRGTVVKDCGWKVDDYGNSLCCLGKKIPENLIAVLEVRKKLELCCLGHNKVSLFNGIPTFVGYLMPKLFSKKNSCGTL